MITVNGKKVAGIGPPGPAGPAGKSAYQAAVEGGYTGAEQDFAQALANGGAKTYLATIGTAWTEDGATGVKSQRVDIPGVLAKHTAKVDHAYTGDGTAAAYEAFVEAENQYLDYVTNGYAETCDGGIVFHIFGDAPTIEIPIVAEVS